MAIDFNCPMCGKNLKSSNENAGKSARCKHCGEGFTIPPLSLTAESERVKPQPAKRDRAGWERLRELWRGDNSETEIETEPIFKHLWPKFKPYAVVILGLVYFLAFQEYYSEDFRETIYDNESEVTAIMIHLTLGSIVFWLLIPGRFVARFKSGIVFVAVCVSIYIQTSTGSYKINTQTGEFFISERHHRHNDKPFFRSYMHHDPYWTHEGPLAETGSRHGEWIFSPLMETDQSTWYWHGEIVTEAEFFRLEAGR